MSDKSWFEYDKKVTYADDDSIEMTVTDGGVGVDVSAFTGQYRAVSLDGATIITVDTAIVLYESGDTPGTTDSFRIPLDTTDLDVALGDYDHQFTWVDAASQKRTIFKGILEVTKKLTEN